MPGPADCGMLGDVGAMLFPPPRQTRFPGGPGARLMDMGCPGPCPCMGLLAFMPRLLLIPDPKPLQLALFIPPQGCLEQFPKERRQRRKSVYGPLTNHMHTYTLNITSHIQSLHLLLHKPPLFWEGFLLDFRSWLNPFKDKNVSESRQV